MSFKGKKKSRLYDSREGYDLYATQYDKKLQFLDSFEQDILLKALGNLKEKKVLDLGCGTGRLVKDLLARGAELSACDISEEMLKITKKKFPNVETVLADAKNLPFEDGSFDVVVASFLIVHLKILDQFFAEVYRVLKKDGLFILTNINQKKAPKLKTENGEIIVKSFYHRPENVIRELEKSFFVIEKETFVVENNIWVNQVIKAKK